MLHLGPGASRKRVPPAPDVPSGNTLGSITRRSHKSPPACSPRASTKSGSLSLASSGHFHAPRPGGRRFPPPRFHSASPPPASPPTPRREDAPRLGLRHHVPCRLHSLRSSAGHIMPPAPKNPVSSPQKSASGESFVSATSAARAATSGRYGVKCCPRHSRRFLHSYRRSVQLGHSCGIT